MQIQQINITEIYFCNKILYEIEIKQVFLVFTHSVKKMICFA